MAALYADENFPFPAVLVLRALGHDVLTPQEEGRAGVGIPDPRYWPTPSRLAAPS